MLEVTASSRRSTAWIRTSRARMQTARATTRRPKIDRRDRDTWTYAGRDLIVRSSQRAVVHRRHILSGAHLAVSSGDGFECLCGIDTPTGSIGASSEDGAR